MIGLWSYLLQILLGFLLEHIRLNLLEIPVMIFSFYVRDLDAF